MSRKRPFTETELQNHIQRMFDEDESNGENAEGDTELSEEDIDTNFDSDSEESIWDKIKKRSEEIEGDEKDQKNEENSLYGDFFIGKDKTTKWYKFENKNVSKIKNINTVKETVGLNHCAQGIYNEIDSFLRIIDINMIDEVIKYTNMHIDQLRAEQTFCRERDCRATTRDEFLAFLGLHYIIGIKRFHHTNVREIWATDGTGVEICRAAMGYKRFLFLTRCLRFDDKATRLERRKIDKLTAIRSFFDGFVNNCKRCFKLSEYTTIDELLHPYRGRSNWVQYSPSKPAKYGIKMYALCDAKTFYTYNLEIYCGKQPDGPYNLSNSPSDIVKRLIQPIENSNRNLTIDNSYTNVPLADYLLEKKITMIGALKKNEPEIPPEFLPHKSKEVHSSLFGFQKDKMITSYVPRKNAAVILLSTLHQTNYIDPTTRKPLVILDYDATKGGVDTVDKMCSTFSVFRITRQWPNLVFYSLLNIAGINSQILYFFSCQTDEKLQRRLFLKNLALSLMKEYLIFRASLQNLPLDVQTFLRINYGVHRERVQEEQQQQQQQQQLLHPPKRGTCRSCVRESKRTSASMKCHSCEKFTCKSHSETKIVCFDCTNAINEPSSD